MKTNCSRPNPVNYWALFFSPPIIGFLFTGDKCFWLNHWSFLKELDDNMVKKIIWDFVFLSSTFTSKNLKSQHLMNTLWEEMKREGGKMQGELFRQWKRHPWEEQNITVQWQKKYDKELKYFQSQMQMQGELFRQWKRHPWDKQNITVAFAKIWSTVRIFSITYWWDIKQTKD